jgi:hypothetical protein
MGNAVMHRPFHRVRGLCCIAILLFAGNLGALEIHVAPLVVDSREAGTGLLAEKNPQKDLVRLLHDSDHQGAVSVTILPERKYGSPRSFLEAAELCEAAGIDYLLYGYIKEGEYSWDCEIKLYVRETNEVAQLFFGRDGTDHYDRMLDELSKKILDYFYGEVGLAPYAPAPEPDRKIFSIPIHLGYWSPAALAKSAETGFVYDYLGRLESITYPDTEVVSYSYNAGGQVNHVEGLSKGSTTVYIEEIGYDEYSQRVYMEYGNGVVTEYSYNPWRRWLDTIVTTNPGGYREYQNIEYSFDPVGNIEGYSNEVYGYSTEQQYSYDALNQLVSAAGTYEHTPFNTQVDYTSRYSQEYDFDSLGELQQQDLESRVLTEPNAHGLTELQP